MENVLIDACCLINLLSTARFHEILVGCGHVFHVCEAVAQESLFIDVLAQDRRRQRMPVDLEPLFNAGVVHRTKPETGPETAAFVRYATMLDDGEAMCLALAELRSWTVATDERKGRRIAIAHGIRTLSTIELLKE